MKLFVHSQNISSDFVLNHFPVGTLSLVKGAPAVGKTAFAISMALRLAQSNRRVLQIPVSSATV